MSVTRCPITFLLRSLSDAICNYYTDHTLSIRCSSGRCFQLNHPSTVARSRAVDDDAGSIRLGPPADQLIQSLKVNQLQVGQVKEHS